MLGRKRLRVRDVQSGADAAPLHINDECVGVDQRAMSDVHDERSAGRAETAAASRWCVPSSPRRETTMSASV